MRKPPRVVQDLMRRRRPREPVPFVDRAPWLKDVPPADEPWINAMAAVDERDDCEPLRKLFRTGTPYSRRVGRYLDDLLERRPFGRRRGGQQTPAYAVSYAEWRMAQAVADVRAGRDIDEVARVRDIDLRSLRAATEGRRGSARRRR